MIALSRSIVFQSLLRQQKILLRMEVTMKYLEVLCIAQSMERLLILKIPCFFLIGFKLGHCSWKSSNENKLLVLGYFSNFFKLYWTENSTVIEGDCEVSLRSSNQPPPVKYVKCDRLQPRIEPVTLDLSPARGAADAGLIQAFILGFCPVRFWNELYIIPPKLLLQTIKLLYNTSPVQQTLDNVKRISANKKFKNVIHIYKRWWLFSKPMTLA